MIVSVIVSVVVSASVSAHVSLCTCVSDQLIFELFSIITEFFRVVLIVDSINFH